METPDWHLWSGWRPSRSWGPGWASPGWRGKAASVTRSASPQTGAPPPSSTWWGPRTPPSGTGWRSTSSGATTRGPGSGEGRRGVGDHSRTLQDTGDIQERRVLLHSARGGRRCPPPLCGEGHLVQSGSDGADWHLVSVLSFWLSDYRRQPIPSVWSPVSACPRSLGISSQPQQKHKYYNFSHIWLEILSIKYILVSRQNLFFPFYISISF